MVFSSSVNCEMILKPIKIYYISCSFAMSIKIEICQNPICFNLLLHNGNFLIDDINFFLFFDLGKAIQILRALLQIDFEIAKCIFNPRVLTEKKIKL